MPVQSAFATGQGHNPSQQPKRVYVCKYVGTPGVDERLKTGNDGLIEVSVNAIDNNSWDGVTVPAWFSDAHDRSYVLGFVIAGQPAPSITQCPGVVDTTKILPSVLPTCGPNNDAVTLPTVPGVTFTQSAWANNKLTVTATLQNGYTWSDNTTAAKVFTFTDDATICERLVATPTPVVTDPCGPRNATWGIQAPSNDYVWSVNLSGELIATANAGTYFIVNGQKVYFINFGTATDSGTLCPTIPPCVITTTTTITDVKQFADYQETKSKGRYSFTKDGLRIYTDDNSGDAKVAWYHNVSYPLSQVGVPAMDYVATTGTAPGMQLVVDFDNDGTPDGILVGEAIYGNDWWLSNGSAQFVKDNAPSHSGGSGSANHGTLDQWLTNFPNAQVKSVGFSLGSGVFADGLLKSLTFGCVNYVFKKPITPCTVSSATYDKPWTYDKTTFPEADKDGGSVPGSYNFEPTGLYLNTPAVESYVYGMFDAGNTPLSDVDVMSYNVLRLPASAGYEATLPAYILSVDTNGLGVAGGMTYFFYEPYNTDAARAANEGVWQTWDALNAGNGKWWMSNTNQKVRTWTDFVNMYPDGVVVAFGFNQGTYNAQTYTAVQDIVFDCATKHFTNTQTGGSGGTGETPTTPVTPTTPAVPSLPSGGQGAMLPTELPMTGSNGSILWTWIALLSAVLTYGAVYFLQPKRQTEE
jgi:hypothetical protein